MQIEQTNLADVLILTPPRFGDERGFFCETWNRNTLSEAGIECDFVQDNQSLSAHKGTVRGLHFQAPPAAQTKLVRCGHGALLDVAVDLRAGSPQFGQWAAVELSADNGHQLLVPAGFAHGFVTLIDHTEILYKCDAPYEPDCDCALMFDDQAIGIDWGITRANAILSVKDAKAPALRDLDLPTTGAFKWECTA
jgi:dTDP-4-dehydrorhamnose 3,5-epimerase